VPDLVRLTRSEQKNLDYLLARAEKHKARIVSFSTVEPQRLASEHDFDADFHARVRAGFLELAKGEPSRFRVIDAARDFAAKLAKAGIDGFSWSRTPPQIKIEKLPTK